MKEASRRLICAVTIRKALNLTFGIFKKNKADPSIPGSTEWHESKVITVLLRGSHTFQVLLNMKCPLRN